MANPFRNVQFVQKGFVRLRAGFCPVDEESGNSGTQQQVCISIEDSGPGIPQEKRGKLFSKFQESLDSLHQGTGIGLAVCRHLIDLMQGDIVLDESYHSGVEGCPGARFILYLNQPPIELEESERNEDHHSLHSEDQSSLERQFKPKSGTLEPLAKKPLPENLCILFVDDDYMLRRLFRRSVEKIQPTWQVDEASNGEVALLMVQSKTYDLIFVDQFMSSISKQMLGTETVRALRANGLTKTCVCGLSANDMENQFLQSGADAFMMKPFPCGKDHLTDELRRILSCKPKNVA